MQNTVRIILVLFLIALILNSYNSMKILNVALTSLNQDFEQRTELIARQIENEISSHPDFNRQQLQEFLAGKKDDYGVLAAIIYGPKGQPEISVNLPPQLRLVTAKRPAESTRHEKYLLLPHGKSLLLIFDAARVLQMERSTKIISYLNLLLMGFAALLAFYFIESTLRPYRALLQAAKSAPPSLTEERTGSEADFLIATFRGVISRLKDKEQELAKLHRAEKARADEVQQLNQDLIRSINSGLLLIDHAGDIRVFNHAAESILQLPRDRVLDRPYGEVTPQISSAFAEDVKRCFEERTDVNRAEVEIKTPNNEVRYLGAHIMPLQDAQQKFAGVFCLFTDITDFKQLQEHMAQKEKFATLGEMAAGVAHEFRNSLATITGYLQLLENKAPSEQKTYTSPIHKELQLLQKVVKDFLSFAGPVQLRIAAVSLQELIRECVEEVRVSEAGRSCVLTVQGNFPQVPGDDIMLRQVFINLLRNAAEATEGTGRPGKVMVTGSTSSNGRLATIEVRDNGSGIPPADLPRIFHPFFSTKEKGVGLGLAIVQKLVVQHNGTIVADSSEEGTAFRVQLPLE
jgi:PAS domain S-box-containing protein